MLTDSYSRKHDYLRVSITDKCNLRCAYCMPPGGVTLLRHDQVLRNEEFVRLIGIFVSMGVIKVRFTGGEPLLRRGFDDILSKTRERFPEVDLCLTTNGTLLGDYVEDLYQYGVRKLNISLDSLSYETYRTVTRMDCLDDVRMSIDRVLSYNYFDVKINAVILNQTIDELDDFLDYFKERDVTLRFIEKMPFTREAASMPFVASDRLLDRLKTKGELKRNDASDTAVAQMYDFLFRDAYPMKIGIIPPLSNKFCSSCNRLRLTSDGFLKTCLHSIDTYDLKSLLRNGSDDDAVKSVIVQAVTIKREGHSLTCWPEDGGCAAVVKTGSMSKIGG